MLKYKKLYVSPESTTDNAKLSKILRPFKAIILIIDHFADVRPERHFLNRFSDKEQLF